MEYKGTRPRACAFIFHTALCAMLYLLHSAQTTYTVLHIRQSISPLRDMDIARRLFVVEDKKNPQIVILPFVKGRSVCCGGRVLIST